MSHKSLKILTILIFISLCRNLFSWLIISNEELVFGFNPSFDPGSGQFFLQTTNYVLIDKNSYIRIGIPENIYFPFLTPSEQDVSLQTAYTKEKYIYASYKAFGKIYLDVICGFLKNDNTGREDAIGFLLIISNSITDTNALTVKALIDTTAGEQQQNTPLFILDNGEPISSVEKKFTKENIPSYIVSGYTTENNEKNKLFIYLINPLGTEIPKEVLLANYRRLTENLTKNVIKLEKDYMAFRYSSFESKRDGAVAISYDIELPPLTTKTLAVIFSKDEFKTSTIPDYLLKTQLQEEKEEKLEKLPEAKIEETPEKAKEEEIKEEIQTTNIVPLTTPTQEITTLPTITPSTSTPPPPEKPEDLKEIQKQISEIYSLIENIGKKIENLEKKIEEKEKVQKEEKKAEKIQIETEKLYKIRQYILEVNDVIDKINERLVQINLYIYLKQKGEKIYFSKEDLEMERNKLMEINRRLEKLTEEIGKMYEK